MPVGYSGVGLLQDDREVDIYRVSEKIIWDTSTGLEVEPISWSKRLPRSSV
jgi:hypothetical protein